MIAPTTSIARRPHRITLQNPGDPLPDPDGGWSSGWTDLDPPQLFASIAPATAADLERVAVGTTTSMASHIVRCPYHPGITTKTRVLFNNRILNVIGVANPEERNVDSILLCAEVVE